MREVAKSFASFSWALSMFTLEQLTNLVSEERSGNRKERLTAAFDSMTRATSEVLSERTRAIFDSGDRLQEEMVDLTFDVFRPESWSPEKILDRAADFAESTADAIRDSGKKDDAEADAKDKAESKAE
jgi:hypothetical protein